MTSPTETITTRICELIIERLELEDFTVEDFPSEAILFAPSVAGGLELDSIASLEIVSVLSDEYDLDFDEVSQEDFLSVKSLAAYVLRELKAAGRSLG